MVLNQNCHGNHLKLNIGDWVGFYREKLTPTQVGVDENRGRIVIAVGNNPPLQRQQITAINADRIKVEDGTWINWDDLRVPF